MMGWRYVPWPGPVRNSTWMNLILKVVPVITQNSRHNVLMLKILFFPPQYCPFIFYFHSLIKFDIFNDVNSGVIKRLSTVFEIFIEKNYELPHKLD